MPPILKEEIKNNKIIIEEPKLYGSYWLIPYRTTENSLFPEGFNNIGQPYHWETPEWLKKCKQTQSFKNETGFFYCRVLSGHLQKAGLNIEISKSIHTKTNLLNIQFFGPLLGTIDLNSLLDGALLWSVHLHVICNKNSIHHLLPDIGVYSWKTYKLPKKQAKKLLAPSKLQIPLNNCKKNDIKKIELRFTEIHTNRGVKKKQIIWKLD